MKNKTCPRIKESKTFSSTYTRQTYKMRHRLTCKSSWVIYLVTCEVCRKQYVGSTTDPLHLRHNGHKSEIKNGSTPLGRHFSQCRIENFSSQAIDCDKPGEKEALLMLEGIWQHRLATMEVHGNIGKRNEMAK